VNENELAILLEDNEVLLVKIKHVPVLAASGEFLPMPERRRNRFGEMKNFLGRITKSMFPSSSRKFKQQSRGLKKFLRKVKTNVLGKQVSPRNTRFAAADNEVNAEREKWMPRNQFLGEEINMIESGLEVHVLEATETNNDDADAMMQAYPSGKRCVHNLHTSTLCSRKCSSKLIFKLECNLIDSRPLASSGITSTGFLIEHAQQHGAN
jgi:hypothetical protein